MEHGEQKRDIFQSLCRRCALMCTDQTFIDSVLAVVGEENHPLCHFSLLSELFSSALSSHFEEGSNNHIELGETKYRLR